MVYRDRLGDVTKTHTQQGRTVGCSMSPGNSPLREEERWGEGVWDGRSEPKFLVTVLTVLSRRKGPGGLTDGVGRRFRRPETLPSPTEDLFT